MRPSAKFRLALLKCSQPVPVILETVGDYTPIFRTLLEASLDVSRPGVWSVCSLIETTYVGTKGTEPMSFTLDGYDVVNKMEYPPDDVECDGLLISGSRKSRHTTSNSLDLRITVYVRIASSAYEDIEWINRLVAYVKRIIEERPKMKIFGTNHLTLGLTHSCCPRHLLRSPNHRKGTRRIMHPERRQMGSRSYYSPAYSPWQSDIWLGGISEY